MMLRTFKSDSYPARNILCLLCRPYTGRLFLFLRIRALLLISCALLTACAGTHDRPQLPYPAFVQADELPDMFMAALPGVRAKPLASNMRTQSASNRIDLPGKWSGTTGGMPGKSLEIYVLAGELKLSDFVLDSGGYAYIPPGSLGFRLSTEGGARILYFVDDVDERAVIRSPLILDGDLVDWQQVAPGLWTKELRRDPGSGATSWLSRIGVDAEIPWKASSALREGYLIVGMYVHSECFNGETQTGQYLPGGYFHRPAGTVNGGPDSSALTQTVWFLRELSGGETSVVDACLPTAP